jgi:hypothetical protein
MSDTRPGGGLERRLPPIAEVAVVSIALMLVGGIYLAAHLPNRPSLGVPVALVIAGGVLTLADMVMLSRIRPFAWSTFFLVIRWALLAYLVIAGTLEFVFVFDHTPSTTMVVLTATLVVFAVDVPTILAFTVARYQATEGEPRSRRGHPVSVIRTER